MRYKHKEAKYNIGYVGQNWFHDSLNQDIYLWTCGLNVEFLSHEKIMTKHSQVL